VPLVFVASSPHNTFLHVRGAASFFSSPRVTTTFKKKFLAATTCIDCTRFQHFAANTTANHSKHPLLPTSVSARHPYKLVFLISRQERDSGKLPVQATDIHARTAITTSTTTTRAALTMPSLSSKKLFSTALCALLAFGGSVAAAPAPQASSPASDPNDSTDYWLGQAYFHQTNNMPGNSNSGYKVYRNVKDYGAAGDGVTDDTNAIQDAMNDGVRCLTNCNSSTTSQAIVFFPQGTYMVHTALQVPYYTQMIGDANTLPTLKATANFTGMAVVDADPYTNGGNDFINQNNFFRQIRNFVIDISGMTSTTGAGIHWQVAQATSLQNIVFNMQQSADTQQQGIFMDNGSGGWVSDLVFNGGKFGAFFGSQQFTSRNLTFNNCQTAIYLNWDWGWTLSGITVNGGTTAVDTSNVPTNQTVGSAVISDSTFSSTYGVRTAFKTGQTVPGIAAGSLIIDNVDMSQTKKAMVDTNNGTILASGKVLHWIAGTAYDGNATQEVLYGTPSNAVPSKAASLLDNNNIFGRSKPQYADKTQGDFLRSQTDGKCLGDGKTVVTSCIQAFLQNAASAGHIAYFEHGIYVVDDTIQVPNNIKIVGELWSTIAATGKNFSDATNPRPVVQVGTQGSNGSVEISDMLFEIIGPCPGAIMVEWNLASDQGQSGMWDTHVRVGGSYGSNLQLANCPTTQQASPSTNCMGAFLMFHATTQASGVYLENTWFWTADHDMEDPKNTQISIYNGRGMLIDSPGPTWLWGTASEHSILYNYQFDGVNALWAGFMQSETPYFQPEPTVPTPLVGYNSQYDDPTFTVCGTTANASSSAPCKDAWGLRIVNSKNVFIYSTGLYSFFNNYEQQCVPDQNCQENMIHIQNSQVTMYAVTTKASVNMILDDAYPNSQVTDAANRDVYGATVAYYNTDS
jgi:glucan 1,3-beta-glucosidase